jgi:hypothetical protein
MVTRKSLLVGLVVALGLMSLVGCEEENVARYDKNTAPETVLSVAPDMGDKIFHKYRVRWTGYDEDGVVVAYRVASVAEDELYSGLRNQEDIDQYLLSLPWMTTDATESLFVFRADRPNSRSHSLYVAAVDNEGKADPKPAATNFMAIDYALPEIQVLISSSIDTIPRVPPDKGDTIPAINLKYPGPCDSTTPPIMIRFDWQGRDPDGSVQEWRYRLDSGNEVTVPFETHSTEYRYWPCIIESSDVWLGFHEFRLVAVDDAGAKSDEKIARFVVNYDPNTYIDGVWTFRGSGQGGQGGIPLAEKQIYPSDTTAVAYHFGQLRFRFHGWDKDGARPDSFRWSVRGTLIQSGADPKQPWVGTPCDTAFCDVTATGQNKPNLDTDYELALLVRARDDLGKVDGTPALFTFKVNYAPVITWDTLMVIGPGKVKFDWKCRDVDQDINRGSSGEQALVTYRYKVDDGPWIQVTAKDRQGLYVPGVKVEGLASGWHRFKLEAYNGDYLLTRSDSMRDSVFVSSTNSSGGGR